MNKFNAKVMIFSALAMVACSPGGTNSGTTEVGSAAQQIDAQKNALVSFKLTDAPNKNLKSVVVDIAHMEVMLAGNGKNGRLILAKDLGPVDLLTLQNGVTLPLQDVVIPGGLQIQQIRLVLKNEGHFAVKGDDSLCELKTPSAQKTGVKIILTNKFNFEAGHAYNIVVDFDALSSVVVQGNGRCLLKPVLKLKSATKNPVGGANSGDGSGNVPGVGDSSDSDSVSAGPGEVLVPEPEVNEPVDDGWDYTPVQDGDYPVLTEDQLSSLL